MKDDVIIIGGGAAGLLAAVALKQKNPSLSVRILEALPRVGKKLATTGNGRCNITNKNISPERYHGNDVGFCIYALQKYGLHITEDFFEKIGVPFVFEGDKAYPMSLQAASVVDCLRFTAEELGVKIATETKVTNIQVSNGNFKIIADNINFLCDNVIIATGLLSGGEKLGCDGKMLELLKKSGFKTVKTSPAIVQIKTETDIVRQLKGIKVNAGVTLKADKKILRRECGEVLFCDYGLSGPPILQVSGGITDNCKVLLDLMPQKTFDEVCEEIKNRKKLLNSRTVDEFFTGMLNKRLGQVILKCADLKLTTQVSRIDNKTVYKIASLLKSLPFKVTGTTGFSSSQVTSGGLDTSGFNSETMESRDYKGLYAIGEILDIDGDCGGFNLQWAWSSAMCAADAIIGGNNDIN